jgi:hypothetical protein
MSKKIEISVSGGTALFQNIVVGDGNSVESGVPVRNSPDVPSGQESETHEQIVRQPDAHGGRPDVFVCYNHCDRPTAARISTALRNAGIHPWLDVEGISTGALWQNELAKVLDEVPSALVLIGHEGVGPWQDLEMQTLLMRHLEKNCVVVPVLLPGALETPLFLRTLHAIDLRSGLEGKFPMVVESITRILLSRVHER